MAVRVPCFESPEEILDTEICLFVVSKDLLGELRPVEADIEECGPRDCRTLKTVQVLQLHATRGPCESEEMAALLDGVFTVTDLTTAFLNGDGTLRGVHGGTFRWKGGGARVNGSLSGLTNAGTHRGPVFDECQPCDAPGYMEGRLCGRIDRRSDRRFAGCDLLGTYRLRFEPSREGGAGRIAGTLEAAILCRCGQPPRTCIDFSTLQQGTGPNPFVTQGVRFTVLDASGAAVPTTDIGNQEGFVGMHVAFTTEISLPVPCSAVEATLVHFLSQPGHTTPPQLEAFNVDGTSAGTVAMSAADRVAQTLPMAGAAINRVVISAPDDESRLLSVCYTPR